MFQSYATTSVSGTGSVGGLVGLNFNEQLTAANLIGNISQSFATGAVSGTDRVGRLVGTNIGSVLQSYATGPVNGASNVGGLVGFNDTWFNFSSGVTNAVNTVGITNPLGIADVLGSVSQSYAIGAVAGTSGVGGLIGSNSGNAQTSSYWDTVTTGQATSAGGTGLTTAQFNAGLPSGFDPAVWVRNPNANNGYPFLSWQTVVVTTPPPPPPTVPVTNVPPQTPSALPIGLIASATVQPTQILGSPSFPGTDPSTVQISLTLPSAPAVNTPATTSGTQQVAAVTAATPSGVTTTPGSAAPAVTGITPTLPGIPPLPPPPPTITRGVGIPPPGETRFVAHEVVLELGIDASPQRVQEVARRLGLSLVVSERFNALRRAIYRFQFSDNRSITQIIRALEANGIIAGAQPNYVYQVTQDANLQVSPAHPGSEAAPAEEGLQASPQEPDLYTLPTTGDPAQYVISKLRLDEVHGRVQGKDVLVALIDSEIDRRHPDLQSAIVERFDAGCGADRPDSHGTGMAGAIASRSYLRGIAPQTRILAICAFGGKSATAESTTIQIIRGIDYAVDRGARVINMSFAGPRDPMLERALRTAHDKGAALIAAAGNKGPKSPPLYPGADPGVIAVTATDAHDNVFPEANRGSYIAVAAPGVDVMVPSPDNGYALSTGTSVAAANVSGVAALLMETKPKLDPETLRYLLATTAKTLNARSRDEAGSGLVDPVRALAANPPQVAPPHPPASTAKSAGPAPPTR